MSFCRRPLCAGRVRTSRTTTHRAEEPYAYEYDRHRVVPAGFVSAVQERVGRRLAAGQQKFKTVSMAGRASRLKRFNFQKKKTAVSRPTGTFLPVNRQLRRERLERRRFEFVRSHGHRRLRRPLGRVVFEPGKRAAEKASLYFTRRTPGPGCTRIIPVIHRWWSAGIVFDEL